MEPRISLVTLGVQDLARSTRFYAEGLGFPTTRSADDGIVFFQMRGTVLALFPYGELAEDIGPGSGAGPPRAGFGGITLAHNVRTRTEVDEVLASAVRAGGELLKPAQDTSWGGYSGYFADPDGYPWEVAWGAFELAEDGSLIVP
jgi:catechol 2,3-dioxygenase-like lactoylglutathione lyase family enzyme